VFHNSADVLRAIRDVSSRVVLDVAVLQMVFGVLTGWLERREREAIAYLIEENRFLRRQLGGRRLRLTSRTDAGWRFARTGSVARR
jgi:hypothetical protein